jgi:D-alanine-D-alanine ligase
MESARGARIASDPGGSAGPAPVRNLPTVKKLRIAVIYGGRSGEHEVSVASAAAVFQHLDRNRYEPIAVRIDKDGRWSIPDRLPASTSAADVIEQGRQHPGARPARSGREALLLAHPGDEQILTIERAATAGDDKDGEIARIAGLRLDVVFPVLHGPYGEDGTVQGLLELANVPYVGAGVLGSAVGMDKAVMKLVFSACGLPIVSHLTVLRRDWNARQAEVTREVEARLGYPVFVKPANLGSSVGISKVSTGEAFPQAVNLAAAFDRKIVIEAAVPRARELECAVLGNDEPEASVVGEVVPSREFYDYEAKYLEDGSRISIPAPLSEGQSAEVRRLAVEAFRAVDCAGMARVDFLMAGDTGRVYVNEINTIPGFTTISMYSKLWEASGRPYPALLDRLVELALARHAEKQHLRTSAF